MTLILTIYAVGALLVLGAMIWLRVTTPAFERPPIAAVVWISAFWPIYIVVGAILFLVLYLNGVSSLGGKR